MDPTAESGPGSDHFAPVGLVPTLPINGILGLDDGDFFAPRLVRKNPFGLNTTALYACCLGLQLALLRNGSEPQTLATPIPMDRSRQRMLSRGRFIVTPQCGCPPGYSLATLAFAIGRDGQD